MSRSEEGSAVVAPQDLVELGRVTGAYGIRGWIKIQPHAAGSSSLLKARAWWLRRSSAALHGGEQSAPWQVEVLSSRTQGSTIVGQLKGMADRDQAEQLRGCTVWVSRAAFPATEDDEYYWVDLIGCEVHGVDEAEAPVRLGRVREVMDNGAHAVLHVTRLDALGQPLLDAKGREASLMVPFVAAHVHAVDVASRRIDTDWPVDF